MNSPGQNAGMGSLSLLQGIFLTQELNQGLILFSSKPVPVGRLGTVILNILIGKGMATGNRIKTKIGDRSSQMSYILKKPM